MTPLTLDDAINGLRQTTISREHLIVFGAMAAVILAVLVWAVFFRKRRRRRIRVSHSHSGHDSGGFSAPLPGQSANVANRRHHHRRKRRREHRPRNPTLAETSGLPPLRTDNPPEPFP